MARNGLAHQEPYLWMGRYMVFNGKMVHRNVFESHNGVIPRGFLVHHRNGDTLDNQIENLELMTQAEHCKLHTPRLGYRAPNPIICTACGEPRTEREMVGNPHRRKCNKCRGEEYRERVRFL